MSLRTTTPVALIVEDEWLMRNVVAEALRSVGWQVVEASTAEAAIALASNTGVQIDLVFTDIQLAGHMSGWDVAEHYRAVQTDVPIIYASGNAPDRSRRVTNSMFFEKPYEPSEIVEACRCLV